jgi:hypothetical protein
MRDLFDELPDVTPEKNKIRCVDIEPKRGYHYLIVNGQEGARFDCLKRALAAREVMLQPNEEPQR